jgi:hypothetical protein
MVLEARVRVRVPGFQTKSIVVVTTLLDPRQTTKEDLATLYRARWNNEVDLRAININDANARAALQNAGIGAQGNLDAHFGVQSHSHADGAGCSKTQYNTSVDQL